MPHLRRACRSPARLRVSRIRSYTPIVASWAERLVSFATVIAVSGSPAMLSACTAQCLQAGAAAATSLDHGPAAGHAAQAPASAATSGHAHHAAPASYEPAGGRSSSPESSNARLVAACGNCCADGQAAVSAGVRVERTDAQQFAAAPSASPLASYLSTAVVVGASPPRPPVRRPSSSRAPFVLRI